jgi:general secretion pathway protein D
MKRISLAMAAALLLSCASARCAETPSGAAPSSPAAASPARIRLRFADTDVADVLRALSAQSGASIVCAAHKRQPITLNVAAAGAEEALRMVTGAAGLAYRRVGRIFVVAPAESLRAAIEPLGRQAILDAGSMAPDQAAHMLQEALPYLTVRVAGTSLLATGGEADVEAARTLLASQPQPEPPASELVDLLRAPAPQAAALLRSLFPALKVEAMGDAAKPGGAIALSGPRSAVEAAMGAIERLDRLPEAREPAPECRVYAIRYASASTLTALLAKSAPNVVAVAGPESYVPPAPPFKPLSGATLGGGTSGSAAPTSSGPDPSAAATAQTAGDRAGTLVLTGLRADLDAALKLLAAVDVKPKQVMVDVRVVDTSPEQLENLGVTWTLPQLQAVEAPSGTQVTNDQAYTRPFAFGAIGRIPMTLTGALNALVTHNEAKILADPRIQVLDNADANIFIGDTIRTQVSQSSISGTTVQVLEFPVGIVLLVRPRVNADGNITMHLHPVVSTITSVDSDGVPQTSSREAETTVMVKDGETMVIGGLISDEITKSITEIPLLSKLPLIGQLFRNRSTDHKHSEILVFVTPHAL